MGKDITISGRTVQMIDLGDLLLDEQAQIVQETGIEDYSEFLNAVGRLNVRAIRVYVKICAHRVDPAITEAEIGGLSFSEIAAAFQEDDAIPPAPPSAEGRSASSASVPSSNAGGSSPDSAKILGVSGG